MWTKGRGLELIISANKLIAAAEDEMPHIGYQATLWHD
jgi:hypothetical protein